MKNDYKALAYKMKEEILENRRALHRFAETGFDLEKTTAFVEEKLRSYGLSPRRVGRAGLVCMVGKGEGKTLLLRADMDALPMKEESGLPFAAENGNCHSCGHDCHTAMLLGAAKLLKEREDSLNGQVKLMFQPAEELLAGAQDMLENGLLENPAVDAAMGMHIMVGHEMSGEPGMVTYKRGCATYSGDCMKITVLGKNAHGSTTYKGVDAINIASYIVLALQEILAREVPMEQKSTILVGTIHGGSSCNTMSGECVMEVSVRADSREAREFLKTRVREMSQQTALAYRGEALVEEVYGMPSLYNDLAVTDAMTAYAAEIVGEGMVEELTEMSGTEDFTMVADRVPSTYLNLGAGSPDGGHVCGMHHPAMVVDEDVLPLGTALYCHCAERFLAEHGE